MLAMLSTTGRVLWRHWPALLVWFVAGIVVHNIFVEIAATIGGVNSTLGLMILPIAVLARLISFVGMFLVMRDGLGNLQAIAPILVSRAERRRIFFDSLMVSILPFFSVYYVWGELDKDLAGYATRAEWITVGNALLSAVTGEDNSGDKGLQVSVTGWTILIFVVAFGGRWVWKRWSAKAPKLLSVLAVYLEVLWVFIAIQVFNALIGTITGWVDQRVAMVWLTEVSTWIGAQFGAIQWVWEAIICFSIRSFSAAIVWP